MIIKTVLDRERTSQKSGIVIRNVTIPLVLCIIVLKLFIRIRSLVLIIIVDPVLAACIVCSFLFRIYSVWLGENKRNES